MNPARRVPPPVGEVVPFQEIRDRLLRMDCREMLSVDDTVSRLGPQEMAYAQDCVAADADVLRRGGTVRGLALGHVCAGPTDRFVYDSLDALGAEHRLLREPVKRFVLVDRRLAVVDAGIADHAVLLTAPGPVAALHSVFETLWTRSLARRARRPHRDDDLLLDLLARGQTDAAAARALGVGERTFRRRVATLMHEHGARSRYELGRIVAGHDTADRPTGPPDPDARTAP